MALLFSNVTVSDGKRQEQFLVTGVPICGNDLEDWIAYQNFITGMELGETINVHADGYLYGDADGYLYGEGGGYTARPEEVAYLTMRLASKPTFLKDRCRKVVSVDFKLLSAIKA